MLQHHSKESINSRRSSECISLFIGLWFQQDTQVDVFDTTWN